MNDHERFEDQLPFYAAGQLSRAEQAGMEEHLTGCARCQEELKMWRAVSREIRVSNDALVAPPALAGRALDQVHAPPLLYRNTQRTVQLLYAQALLVQRDLWLASAAVMALGVCAAFLARVSGIIYFLAPLVMASTLAVLFTPDHDPAIELTLSTPTSPWKVLLARLSIVSAYNLVLIIIAILALLFIAPPDVLGSLAFDLLGPMAFLSALALLLSFWMGTNNAIAITYGLWMLQNLPYQLLGEGQISPAWEPVILAYQQFWHSPLLLFFLSVFLMGMVLWSANRPVFRMSQDLG